MCVYIYMYVLPSGRYCKCSYQSVVRRYKICPAMSVFFFFFLSSDWKLWRVLQRALPIRILSVGKKRSRGVQLIVDDYIKKISLYCPVEDIRVKSNPKNARLVGIFLSIYIFFLYPNWILGLNLIALELLWVKLGKST